METLREVKSGGTGCRDGRREAIRKAGLWRGAWAGVVEMRKTPSEAPSGLNPSEKTRNALRCASCRWRFSTTKIPKTNRYRLVFSSIPANTGADSERGLASATPPISAFSPSLTPLCSPFSLVISRACAKPLPVLARVWKRSVVVGNT